MNFFSSLSEKEKYNCSFALITIIGATGTVSLREGRMAVFLDGTSVGTIGGGEHEMKARALAIEALKNNKGGKKRIKVKDYGEIEVMIDIPVKNRGLIIIGAGHVGKALYDVFYYLGWHVSVIDTRSFLLNEKDYPYAQRIVSESIKEGLETLSIDSSSAIVSTIPEEIDNIKGILDSSSAFYIGLLSSRRRKAPDEKRYHLPMGLEIGAETSQEIALSVAAEVLASYNSRSALSYMTLKRKTVVVRGAGDLATGVIVALHKAGYSVIATEVEKPTVIRRTVSFAEGIYTGSVEIEGVKSRLCSNTKECHETLEKGEVALIVDRNGDIIREIKPRVVVDAILAKKNLGTTIDMAPFVVALGPGFTAGKDASVVIETMRGHNLARIIYCGSALPNTGVPGLISGYGKERVIHTPHAGTFYENVKIGDIVKKGDIIAYVDSTPIRATIDGRLRGLLHSDLLVPEHFKCADIDPRGEEVDYTSISDKARSIGSSVCVAVDEFLSHYN